MRSRQEDALKSFILGGQTSWEWPGERTVDGHAIVRHKSKGRLFKVPLQKVAGATTAKAIANLLRNHCEAKCNLVQEGAAPSGAAGSGGGAKRRRAGSAAGAAKRAKPGRATSTTTTTPDHDPNHDHVLVGNLVQEGAAPSGAAGSGDGAKRRRARSAFGAAKRAQPGPDKTTTTTADDHVHGHGHDHDHVRIATAAAETAADAAAAVAVYAATANAATAAAGAASSSAHWDHDRNHDPFQAVRPFEWPRRDPEFDGSTAEQAVGRLTGGELLFRRPGSPAAPGGRPGSRG